MTTRRYRTESEALSLFHGATATDLSKIFGFSTTEIQNRLAGNVTPATAPGVHPIRWKIKDAAPYLVKVALDQARIDQIIQNMKPSELPPRLNSAYWDARLKKLQHDEKVKSLWSSQRVVEILGEAFKPLAMAVRMFQEDAASEQGLSQAQKDAAQTLGDSLLASMQRSLVDRFADYVPAPDEHGDNETPEQSNAALGAVDDFDDGFGGEGDGFGDD